MELVQARAVIEEHGYVFRIRTFRTGTRSIQAINSARRRTRSLGTLREVEQMSEKELAHLLDAAFVDPAEVPEDAYVSYRLQYRQCGKALCRSCRNGGHGHGPYVYGFWRDGDGHARSFYVGKIL